MALVETGFMPHYQGHLFFKAAYAHTQKIKYHQPPTNPKTPALPPQKKTQRPGGAVIFVRASHEANTGEARRLETRLQRQLLLRGFALESSQDALHRRRSKTKMEP